MSSGEGHIGLDLRVIIISLHEFYPKYLTEQKGHIYES